VVCWSTDSVGSEWVKNEAAAGAERNVLVPVFLDDVRLPLEFRRRQTVSLVGWDGEASHPGFSGLREGIRAVTGGKPRPEALAESRTVLPASRRKWLWGAAAAAAAALAVAATLLAYRNYAPREEPGPSANYPVTAQILASGTAVSKGVFTPRGDVLAMAHGVPDPRRLEVAWEENGVRKTSAATVAKHGLLTGEVVLLRLRDPTQRRFPFPIRIAATLQPGEKVERYLSPSDRAPGKVTKVFAEMQVHGSDGPVRLERLLLTSMIAGPGDSGAPVLDAEGRVVGLVYAASQTETVSLMIEDVKASFAEEF
jgi:S1-C subfamily serine protease